MPQRQISLIEPYDGGSHLRFREDWASVSQHRFKTFTQSPRQWKWRMRASAVHFLPQLDNIMDSDVLVVSGFLNVAEFKGLAHTKRIGGRSTCEASRFPPCVLIMHENQLTYPYQVELERDYHFVFTNITSCLAADAVWFNSAFHRDAFLEALPAFLGRMRDAFSLDVTREIREKSSVMHLGVRSPLESLTLYPSPSAPAKTARRCVARPLRIGWNHRWEFDKQPEVFFSALKTVQKRGHAFELVVLGEQFRQAPAVFAEAREALKGHIAHWGYAPDYATYASLLAGCDVIVSTAAHEFFGMAVVEAALCGCALLLPRRLSYPELFPKAAQNKADVFYASEAELVERMCALAEQPGACLSVGQELRAEADRFLWVRRGPALDKAITALCEGA